MWNMKTFASKNYKMVQLNNKMTTREFIAKVAKIFNVRKEFIFVTYDFDTGDEVVKVEIEESNDNSLYHAVEVLKNYSKLTVEVKLQPSPAEISIADGKRVLRSKEVVAEQLKREMGLHDDAGKRTRVFLDAKWTTRCDQIMKEDSRFLLEFDKTKAGVKLVFGNDGYLLNPFQVICPICMEIKVLSSMNQLCALSQHLKDKHLEDSKGISVIKRLGAWLENHFVSGEELDQLASIPELISLQEVLTTTRVRAMVLARDIL